MKERQPPDHDRTIAAGGSDTGAASGAEQSRRIGPYKLLQQIGEGGMGTVWMADQVEPVQRRVAVKLIKTGIVDKQVIARFEAERQALALMDHQNIARVLDAGTADDGTPYFVMELVQGNPITEYCDINKLTPRERLELFIPVCRAVQHAHQKGIIHRDLKPSNVLVAYYDGRPVAKVIDFGLAKALQPEIKLTDKTMFTEFGRVMGTVQYMSPEQARLDAVDVDTRSDVYALGVILYELLAGSTPVEQATVRKQALLKVLEMVRDQDPPRPSHRLSTSAERLRTISNQRRIEPAKLQQILRGDLDWIVMKALEKDRTRRYDSATGFAEDIERFLSGEPVEARPPTIGYQAGKFVRKHRALVAMVALTAFLFVAGIAGTTIFAIRAHRSQAIAEASARDAQVSAKRSDDVLQVVTSAFESVDPSTGSDATMSAKDVLLQAQASLRESDLDDFGRLTLLGKLAEAFRSLGEYEESIAAAEQGVELLKRQYDDEHVEVQAGMNHLGMAYHLAGRRAEAIAIFERLLPLAKETSGIDHGFTLNVMRNLAIGYQHTGRLDEAVSLLEEVLRHSEATFGPNENRTLQAMGAVATAYQLMGRHEDALALQQTAWQRLRDHHGPDHPDTLIAQNGLVVAYLSLHRGAEAIPIARELVEETETKFGTDHPYYSTILNNLGSAYAQAGRNEESLALYEKSLQLKRSKLGAEHPTTLVSMHNLAGQLKLAGRLTEARALFEQTLKLRRKVLGEDHQETLFTMNGLADIYQWVGELNLAVELAEQTYAKSRERLGAEHTGTLRAAETLAIAYQSVGRLEESISLVESALKIRHERFPVGHQRTLTAMANLASAYTAAGRADEALPLYQRALTIAREELGDKHPTTQNAIENLAGAYMDSDRLEMATELYEEVMVLRTEQFGAHHVRTLNTLSDLAVAYERAGRFDEAATMFEQYFEGADSAEQSPWFRHLAEVRYGRILLQLEELDESAEFLVAGYEGLQRSRSSIPKPERNRRLQNALESLIKLAEMREDADDAAKWREELSQLESPE